MSLNLFGLTDLPWADFWSTVDYHLSPDSNFFKEKESKTKANQVVFNVQPCSKFQLCFLAESFKPTQAQSFSRLPNFQVSWKLKHWNFLVSSWNVPLLNCVFSGNIAMDQCEGEFLRAGFCFCLLAVTLFAVQAAGHGSIWGEWPRQGDVAEDRLNQLQLQLNCTEHYGTTVPLSSEALSTHPSDNFEC